MCVSHADGNLRTYDHVDCQAFVSCHLRETNTSHEPDTERGHVLHVARLHVLAVPDNIYGAQAASVVPYCQHLLGFDLSLPGVLLNVITTLTEILCKGKAHCLDSVMDLLRYKLSKSVPPIR